MIDREVVAIVAILSVWLWRYLIDGHEARCDLGHVVVVLPLLLWNYRPLFQDLILVNLRSTAKEYEAYLALSLLVVVFIAFVPKLLSSGKNQAVQGSELESTYGPYILPCRTTHTRMFPKTHSFSYSYLQVAIPVGWRGSIGSMVAVGPSTARTAKSGNAWFSVNPSDYLYRGGQNLSLDEKLSEYLTSQSVSPSSYNSAWLVTAPRFLGYSFNPVSFWYLYQDSSLKSMILEVNNTFDERRLYLMDVHSDPDFASQRYRNAWPKDFHVSPFNSRKGSYALSAKNPDFAAGAGIDNTITLSSSKHHAKLVARICSTAPPIDPREMTLWQRYALIAAWWWVGFVTFPRIVREAGKLFFQRKLHVWYRPEVLVKSIGRNETRRERLLERCWRRYIQSLAGENDKKAALLYVASGNAAPREEMFGELDGQKEALRFHVLTPQFYSDVVAAGAITKYLESNAGGPPEAKTFDCSSLADFVALVRRADASGSRPRRQAWPWKFLASLRERSFNELDAFVLGGLDTDQSAAYRKAATAQLLSNVLALGLPASLDGFVSLLRVVAIYAAANKALALLIAGAADWPPSLLATVATALEACHLATALGSWMLSRRGNGKSL